MNYAAEFLIMLILALLVPAFFLNYRKKLLRKERESQAATIRAVYDAEERQKLAIANNLHDEILPGLSLIVQNVDLNKIDFKNGRFNIDNISRDKETALSSMQAIRSIALDLTPKVLIDLGLLKALQSFVSRIRSANYAVAFENKSKFDEVLPFKKSEEINIYRACLEVLKNVQKHENFTKLNIIAANSESELSITFLHNGDGITDKEIKTKTDTSSGLGLRSLKSRIMLLNASLSYIARPGDSEIRFVIPLKR